MLKDITLGQFFPGDSIIHKLDPRIKIILLILYIITLFSVKSKTGYLIMGITTLVLMIISKIPLKLYIRGLKPLFLIVCFTGILNLFYSSGNIVFSFWFLKITDTGICNALTMIVRILILVMMTSMLTYTTSPIVLTNGLERLLSPLGHIGLPVSDFSMMITIALRFIPTLLDETDKIMSAQKARGADFESGGLFKRAKALIPILIPLIISAFRRADELATAMECRCYTGDSKGRTHLIQYNIRVSDIISVCLIVVLFIVILFLNHVII